MPEDGGDLDKKKAHRERNSGRKAEKKKGKNEHVQELTDKQRNPKAFAINSVVRAERRFRRNQDLTTKKQHIPLIDRTPVEPPPIIVAVVGPPKVGKTILIRCLIKSFARMPLTDINGPVTLVSGKKRRITLIECNNDINSMIDIAKVADLVLLLIDASFGFEMEIFEFLNICQVHGMPRIMGVLTHLDMLKNQKQLKKTKKALKHRFWTEVFSGAKLFYLSGLQYDEYLRNEVSNLGRFISVMKFRPLVWRSTHPYLLADRIEDLTPPELIRQNPSTDRTVSLYGFVRGVPLSKSSSIHIPGCGDFKIQDVSSLPDPCPLPDKQKKRALGEKERLVYAPFSGVGGIVYDKDAVYVELGGSHSHVFRHEDDPGSELVTSMLTNQEPLDMKMARSELQLFTNAEPIMASDYQSGNFKGELITDDSGRTRRKVVFPDPNIPGDDDNADQSDDEEDLADQSDDSDSGLDLKPSSSWKKPPKVNISKVSESEDDSSDNDDDNVLNEEDVPWNVKGVSEESQEMFEPPSKKLKADSKVLGKVKSAERKLLMSLGDDMDEEEEDNDEEDEEEMDLTIKSDDDETEIQKSVVYRGISTTKDQEIKNKISDALTRLSDPSQSVKSSRESIGESDEDVLKRPEVPKRKREGSESEEDGSDATGDEGDEEEGSAVKWKTNLAQKAADAFLERQSTTQNLWKLVYGVYNTKLSATDNAAKEAEDGDEAEGGDVGGLFRIVDKKQREQQEQRDVQDGLDCARFAQPQTRDWSVPDVRELIRDCFVTGKWKQSEDAAELLRLDDTSDNDLYGDFEDLETGETHAKEPAVEADDDGVEEPVDQSKTVRGKTFKEKTMEKKRKLKAKFDAEYDDQEGGKSFYDDLKAEVNSQAQLNKSEFEGMPEDLRLQMEGYRAGLYVRVEIANVPCELITNFDPTYPLIVGGLQAGEENIGYVQVRAKKHRWHKKILKTRDPLIISLGWRRFQSLPIFAKLEDNMRHRYLKYTPEHVACMAHFWGPITPQNTGFLAIQDVATRVPGFRIAATGTVVELDKSSQIMKKLKLTGTPLKIYTKTAFIQGMFNSALEVARFEGAKLRTVSGIRGQIKKASKKPEGSFRATFEDKIQLSDIVFCRTWYRVDVPTLYNPVTSLLLPVEQKNTWRGMKTVGQLKRENNVRAEVSSDNLYLPIHRDPKLFRPLVIPKALQRELPYKDKPKKGAANPARTLESQRIAVIREPHEQKVQKMLTMLKASYGDKQDRMKAEMSTRIKKYKKKMEGEEAKKGKRQRDLRKQVFKTLSQMETKSKTKKGRRR